ncbi:MAG: hypothetical protein ABI270_05580 [Nitrosospira sp.]
MASYIVYKRSSGGEIHRIGYVVFDSKSSLDQYTHAESLVGYPERNIFWDNSSGPSVGVTLYEPENMIY